LKYIKPPSSSFNISLLHITQIGGLIRHLNYNNKKGNYLTVNLSGFPGIWVVLGSLAELGANYIDCAGTGDFPLEVTLGSGVRIWGDNVLEDGTSHGIQLNQSWCMIQESGTVIRNNSGNAVDLNFNSSIQASTSLTYTSNGADSAVPDSSSSVNGTADGTTV